MYCPGADGTYVVDAYFPLVCVVAEKLPDPAPPTVIVTVRAASTGFNSPPNAIGLPTIPFVGQTSFTAVDCGGGGGCTFPTAGSPTIGSVVKPGGHFTPGREKIVNTG